MADYIAEIDNNEWWIYKKGFDFSKQSQYRAFSDHFAGSGLENGKIAYFFDIGISKEDIKKLQNDTIFLESANFTFIKNGKSIKHFKGSFIDALRVIKEEL